MENLLLEIRPWNLILQFLWAMKCLSWVFTRNTCHFHKNVVRSDSQSPGYKECNSHQLSKKNRRKIKPKEILSSLILCPLAVFTGNLKSWWQLAWSGPIMLSTDWVDWLTDIKLTSWLMYWQSDLMTGMTDSLSDWLSNCITNWVTV